MPVHGYTGAGGLHRRSPVGGAANGIPRYTQSPSCCSPEIYPASVFTTAGSGFVPGPDESDECFEQSKVTGGIEVSSIMMVFLVTILLVDDVTDIIILFALIGDATPGLALSLTLP